MRSRWFYNLYVFIGGAAVMLLEFAASRLLAPYFGTSIFVWGNIIGAILIALSVGYFLGGKLADRKPDISVISRYVLIACIFISFIPMFMQWLVVPLSTFYITGIVGSFVAIVGLFALPVVLLGMISPFLIRVATLDIKSAGAVAGGLYAWSTIGSIVGTFAGAFFIVPFLGSRETIFISAFLLGCIGLLGLKRYRYSVILLLPISLYVWFGQQPLRADAVVIEEGETLYQYYAVTDQSDRLLLQYNEGLGTQSYYMKQGVQTDSYYDYIALAPTFQGQPNGRAVVLGLAGGTLTRLLTVYFPEWDITGVELDGEIVEVAKRRFHLTEQPITIVVDDGRQFMQATDEQFDVIFIDVFTNEYYIPWHMTTVEFMETLAERQPADGMVALNIGSTSQATVLFRALLNTVQTVYPQVYIMTVPDSINYVVFAAKQPMDIPNTKPYQADPMVPILTDNRAPIELYTEQMIWRYILDL